MQKNDAHTKQQTISVIVKKTWHTPKLHLLHLVNHTAGGLINNVESNNGIWRNS